MGMNGERTIFDSVNGNIIVRFYEEKAKELTPLEMENTRLAEELALVKEEQLVGGIA